MTKKVPWLRYMWDCVRINGRISNVSMLRACTIALAYICLPPFQKATDFEILCPQFTLKFIVARVVFPFPANFVRDTLSGLISWSQRLFNLKIAVVRVDFLFPANFFRATLSG